MSSENWRAQKGFLEQWGNILPNPVGYWLLSLDVYLSDRKRLTDREQQHRKNSKYITPEEEITERVKRAMRW